jgi:D-alanyl-D-alanine carboxypeptidase/D-alanyl-D-alanine-endopeptidase (penicillin-binding protein 4)
MGVETPDAQVDVEGATSSWVVTSVSYEARHENAALALERELPFLVTMIERRIRSGHFSLGSSLVVALTLLALAAPAFDASASLAAQDPMITTEPAAAVPTPAVHAATPDPDPQRRRRRRVRRRRVSAIAPVPAFTAPRSVSALASDMGSMLGGGARGGRWGVLVVSLTRGDTLFSRGENEMLQPASTFKLMTSVLALDRFGPEYQLSTDVFRDGPLATDGTVQGNLYLRGAGDPGFSNRFLRGDPSAPVDLLAQFICGAGVKYVSGDLVADASAFEDRKIPEGWRSRYLGLSYAAPVSALSLNENTVWVVVEPGENGGAPTVHLDPASSSLTVTSSVKLVKGSRGARLSVRRDGQGAINARGWIGSRAGPRRYELVVDEPALFTAGALRSALAEKGVTVAGVIRLGTTPGNAQRVTGFPSPPLSRLIAVMNRESVNHYAELLFRNASRGTNNTTGSAEAGNAMLRRFAMERLGVDSADVYAADGSGLSVLDRVTPRAMVHLLDYAHRASWGSAFHASLPVAGESELLRRRMRSTPAQGNLHAKTGTTNNIISLAGYVTALDGEVLAFAFIYNGNDRWRAKETIDQMGATLANFVRE